MSWPKFLATVTAVHWALQTLWQLDPNTPGWWGRTAVVCALVSVYRAEHTPPVREPTPLS
jgi:hypothetical protein